MPWEYLFRDVCREEGSNPLTAIRTSAPDCRDQRRAGSCHIFTWREPSTRVPARLMNRGRGQGKVAVFSSSWEASTTLERKEGELAERLKDMKRDLF